MAWQDLLRALWLFLPAYIANMSPVLSAKVAPRWKRPIDGGRVHKDGRRVLGDGKTWRGLVGGGLTAGLTALALSYLAGGIFADDDFGLHGPFRNDESDTTTSAWWAVFVFGTIVGAMALVGDAVESYAKRRLGKERGAPWIPFDQLDFVIFGLAGIAIAAPLLADGWVRDAYWDPWILGTILIGTPFLHLAVNGIGYLLKLKDVPW